MPFDLMKLSYEEAALEPSISRETVSYHYGKHHQNYVNKLNELIKGTEFEEKKLEEIILAASGIIFNNAAQVWNHNFYWNGLTPIQEASLSEPLKDGINKTFGSLVSFKDLFIKNALNNFGSGWTWLVKNLDQSLEIINTSNAANPLVTHQTPLLTCDVWEHAYYIDYRHERLKYLQAFFTLVNWKYVSDNFER